MLVLCISTGWSDYPRGEPYFILTPTYTKAIFSRVLTELWKLLQESDEQPQGRIDSIIADLRYQITGRRDYLKETSLITLGAIGR
jgi:hypothetical protein